MTGEDLQRRGARCRCSIKITHDNVWVGTDRCVRRQAPTVRRSRTCTSRARQHRRRLHAVHGGRQTRAPTSSAIARSKQEVYARIGRRRGDLLRRRRLRGAADASTSPSTILTIESSAERANMDSSTNTNNIINTILPFDTENTMKSNASYLTGFTSKTRPGRHPPRTGGQEPVAGSRVDFFFFYALLQGLSSCIASLGGELACAGNEAVALIEQQGGGADFQVASTRTRSGYARHGMLLAHRHARVVSLDRPDAGGSAGPGAPALAITARVSGDPLADAIVERCLRPVSQPP